MGGGSEVDDEAEIEGGKKGNRRRRIRAWVREQSGGPKRPSVPSRLGRWCFSGLEEHQTLG